MVNRLRSLRSSSHLGHLGHQVIMLYGSSWSSWSSWSLDWLTDNIRIYRYASLTNITKMPPLPGACPAQCEYQTSLLYPHTWWSPAQWMNGMTEEQWAEQRSPPCRSCCTAPPLAPAQPRAAPVWWCCAPCWPAAGRPHPQRSTYKCRYKSRIALSFSMPGIKMCCDGYKRDGLHDDILPMEDPLPAKLVNDLVLLSVHREHGTSPACLAPYHQEHQ